MSGGGGKDCTPYSVESFFWTGRPYVRQIPAIERRTVLKGAMVMAGMASAAQSVTQAAAQPAGRLADVPLSPDTRVMVERRGQIVLIGINRPQMFNRMDPEGSHDLALAL